MKTWQETLWAVAEIFGDRQDITDGLSFIGVMFVGLVMMAVWG